jgi:hypothetical protein
MGLMLTTEGIFEMWAKAFNYALLAPFISRMLPF